MNLLYLKAIAIASKKAGVDCLLLLSICLTETNLTNVTNVKDHNRGSHGICQVNAIHTNNIAKLYDPNTNALIAAKILKSNLDKYKKTWVAVSAYSTGNNRWFNRKYVNNVRKTYWSLVERKEHICLNETGTLD